MTGDNRNQQTRIAKLRPLVEERLSGLQATIDSRRKAGKEARVLLSYRQMEISGNISALLNEMKQAELKLLDERILQTDRESKEAEQTLFLVVIASVAVSIAAIVIVVKTINNGVSGLLDGTRKIAAGDLDSKIEVTTKDELASVAKSFNSMSLQLKEARNEQHDKNWIKTSLNNLALELQGVRDPLEAGRISLEFMVKAMDAQWGVVYGCGLGTLNVPNMMDEAAFLNLIGTYACSQKEGIAKILEFGEGLAGQVAISREKHLLTDLTQTDVFINSATTHIKPVEIIVFPLLFENKLRGVVELGSTHNFTEVQLELVDELIPQLGVIFHSIAGQVMTENLLQESQLLNEELQAQQEELESQQEELRQANEELEQKADVLDLQFQAINEKNRELEQLQFTLEDKARELEQASKYKSEFLANMSHDLRTPLNSLLIFSELLSDNESNHLDESELEFAKNIRLAGKSLLTLIDDILDLSKIESGTISLDLSELPFELIETTLKRNFEKDAKRKKLDFQIHLDSDLPKSINVDQKRLFQLLNNLLSNAFKFTEKGGVSISIKCHESDPETILFAVADTGIGISEEKHQIIFEAFQQAESHTKTKYGGTGLGLAICRKLAELMGGNIQVTSKTGLGSTFTVSLPVKYLERGRQAVIAPAAASTESGFSRSDPTMNILMESEIPDDRFEIKPGDRVLLIIEDDPSFASMLLNVARKNGFKGVAALRGGEGLELARKIIPDGITLDLKLPDTDGWVILDQLKNSSDTRQYRCMSFQWTTRSADL